MGLSHSPNIVTDGLVLCLDAGNRRSYPGSGNIWYDLSGNANNAILVNSPSFLNNKSGALLFDGVNDYAYVTLFNSNAFTVEIVYRLLNPSSGWGPLWRTNDWRERIFPSSVTLINSSLSYYYLSGPDASTNLINICYSYSGTNAKSYKNGILQSNVTMNSAMNVGNFTYRFANQSGGSTNAYINCEIYTIKFFHRQLEDSEILQNFNATRGRFGL